MNEANPISILAIDHVVIATANIAVMQDFYVTVLGCRVERTLPEIGLIQMRAGHSMIDLVPLDAASPAAGNMDHLCLTLEQWDADAIMAHAERHCVPFEPPAQRYGATGMGSSIYIADPDGNRIELKEAK